MKHDMEETVTTQQVMEEVNNLNQLMDDITMRDINEDRTRRARRAIRAAQAHLVDASGAVKGESTEFDYDEHSIPGVEQVNVNVIDDGIRDVTQDSFDEAAEDGEEKNLHVDELTGMLMYHVQYDSLYRVDAAHEMRVVAVNRDDDDEDEVTFDVAEDMTEKIVFQT